MTELLDTMLGPQVAIIDNNAAEIRSIEVTLNQMNIGNRFFEVDYTEPNFPSEPISTVELVFLDLYYNPGMNAEFDPYACIDWLTAIVPSGKKYILIVWSNDPYQTDYLLKIMKETGAPMPFLVETKEKSEYQTADGEYDIERLLSELNIELEQKIEITSQDFFGRVIQVEENNVLINCLIHEEPATFEVRRFDLKPFQGELKAEKGMFLRIKITNKPGSKVFDFIHETTDMSDRFKKSDDFEDFEDTSFLKEDSEEDEDNV